MNGLAVLAVDHDEFYQSSIQKDSPGGAKEANWLPAPDDTLYLVMRLYSPKDTAPSILPPGIVIAK